jgi:hypothetical protein
MSSPLYRVLEKERGILRGKKVVGPQQIDLRDLVIACPRNHAPEDADMRGSMQAKKS